MVHPRMIVRAPTQEAPHTILVPEVCLEEYEKHHRLAPSARNGLLGELSGEVEGFCDSHLCVGGLSLELTSRV